MADVARKGVRFINRERGARLLFETLLLQEKVPIEAIGGYSQAVGSHPAAAQTIRT